MRAYAVRQFGVEHLEQMELPMLQIAPGMVLIRVHAVSLNYRDLMMVKGQYNPRMAVPRIPCSDGAGEVVAIGEGVGRVRVGDRVCGIFMQRWLDGPLTAERSKAALGGDVDGMLAEYVLLAEDGVVRFPEHLSYEEAATLPCAGVTAWNALHYAGEPRDPALAGRDDCDSGDGWGFDVCAAVREAHGGAGDWDVFERREAGAGPWAWAGRGMQLPGAA